MRSGAKEPPRSRPRLTAELCLESAPRPRSECDGQPPEYVLHAQEEEIDSLRFEALVTRARGCLATDPATAARMFRDALRLWLGEPLADLASELSLQPEIERLSELRRARSGPPRLMQSLRWPACRTGA